MLFDFLSLVYFIGAKAKSVWVLFVFRKDSSRALGVLDAIIINYPVYEKPTSHDLRFMGPWSQVHDSTSAVKNDELRGRGETTAVRISDEACAP